MATWEDLFNEQPTGPEPIPMPEGGLEAPSLQPPFQRTEKLQAMAVAMTTVASAVPDLLSVIKFKLNGTEPPRSLVRFHAEGQFRSDGRNIELARCFYGGYWWVGAGDRNPHIQGWSWSEAPLNHIARDTPLIPILPEVEESRLDGPPYKFLKSLVMTLPHDENWYQVGVERNIPVWGWRGENEDDWGTQRSTINPDGSG